jgi:aryl-alcohol dehydrogenase-like predicted oxidoreductase
MKMGHNPALGGLRLVLGGNVFGWTVDQKESFAILDAFVDGGGQMIDTADVYSAWIPGNQGGESETVIGAWLKASGKRDKVKIATKVGMWPGEGGSGLQPTRIAAAFEASLDRLQTDYIDLYYAHQDDLDTEQAAVAGAFNALVTSGRARALGASNFTADRLQSALAAGTKYSVYQPEYNLVARGPMIARLTARRDGKMIPYEGALQDLCVDRGISVLPYFGLASGFLTGKYRGAADVAGPRAYRVADYMCDDGLSVIAAMDRVAADTGASLTQIALAWLNAQPGIAAPIASVSSLAQLEELVGASQLKLSTAHLALLTNSLGTDFI